MKLAFVFLLAAIDVNEKRHIAVGQGFAPAIADNLAGPSQHWLRQFAEPNRLARGSLVNLLGKGWRLVIKVRQKRVGEVNIRQSELQILEEEKTIVLDSTNAQSLTATPFISGVLMKVSEGQYASLCKDQ